jgi:hypothetical protein
MVAAAFLTRVLDTARETFDLLLSVGAGTGLIYLLRWFWWRINAWSEVAAMASSFLVAVGFFLAGKSGHPVASHVSLVITIGVTTLVWIAATFLTRPTDRKTLIAFYRLVRPAGPGWGRVRAEAGVAPSPDSLPMNLLGWVLGCVFIYAALFGAGSALYGRTGLAVLWIVLFLASGTGLAVLLPRLWFGGEA